MQKTFLALAIVAIWSTTARSEAWSLGIATGPFIFGHFLQRTVTINNETGSATTTSRLSAATRAGAAVDVERHLNDWLAVRLEGTWTRAPLRIKSKSGDQGVTIDAGRLNVTTFVVPLVVQFNRKGALRFQVMGGPAYALYDVHRRAGGGTTFALFEGTRARWGGAGAVGAAWWWNSRFSLEWQAREIITTSPFRVSDVASSPQGIRIPKPHNGHTTIGIRYRF
ncbi:MAG TPA: hypothetical protein VKL19_03385 [Thermoanaerobaculia bacterium]|nr:hypothetical protein [Thermoanaerobaculia bacterium]